MNLDRIVGRLRGPARRVGIVAVDGLLAAACLWLALLLRFDGAVPERWKTDLGWLLVVLVVARIGANVVFQLHRWSFLLSGLTDSVRVAASGLFGTGLFLAGVYLARLQGPPRSVVVMELLLSTAMMGLLRFLPRLAWMYKADLVRSRRPDAKRVLIVGAGVAGELLLRDLQRSDEHAYQVVGFLDDDRRKWGNLMGGRRILGGIDDLPTLARSQRVSKVLIAIPRMPAQRIREILSHCQDLKLEFKILPVSFVYLQERDTLAGLQDLSPEDLLQRETVVFPEREEASFIAGRTALVTGAAGSIGSEICSQLLSAGLGRLVMVDVDENGLYLRERRFERLFPEVEVVAEVASVRDAARMERLFAAHRPQDVFHAAAHKHVPLMEAAPCEAVKNNVGGTLHVARAAQAAGAERFVFISTDKAVRPSSVMGATKRVGEMLVRRLADGSGTSFCAVRFGNVLDSAGSVVPLFREQIAAGGPVTVTHPEVRRFFMTIGEAVGLVLQAAYGGYGTLCVLEMGEQIRILDLARLMITMAGRAPEVEIPIEVTGLRPGEKLAEELLTGEEERTHRIDRKILVAESPPPPADLLERLETLLEAAGNDDAEAVLGQLRGLVPSYGAPSAVRADAPAPPALATAPGA